MISDPHKKLDLSIKGKIIPVWTYGEIKNPIVVYIHGLYRPFSTYIGDLPMRHMRDKYFIICFDLPGEGKSKDLEMDNLEFIKSVIDAIAPKRKVTMFGYSYGGLLSLMFTAKYPEKVKEIIIAGTPVIYGVFKSYELTKYIPLFYHKRIEKKVFTEFKFLNSKHLSQIKIPVLLYYNKHDYVANILMGRKLLKMLPNAKLFTAEHLNHRYGLHRIDQTGLLTEIENLIKIEAKNS